MDVCGKVKPRNNLKAYTSYFQLSVMYKLISDPFNIAITLQSLFPSLFFPQLLTSDIVDKTANFVARNGPEFEARIRQHEQNNPKFNFLNPGDPYHAYYQHKVNECRTGKTGNFSSFPALQSR